MIRFIGVFMIIVCGAAAGFCRADEIMKRLTAVQCAKDMIQQIFIMLEYEAPTVDEMLRRLKSCGVKQPLFIESLPENADRYTLISSIDKSNDGFEQCDRDKLKEYFTCLGTADRECEEQRTSGFLAYLENRERILQPICENRARLSKSLGLLLGILIAIILI